MITAQEPIYLIIQRFARNPNTGELEPFLNLLMNDAIKHNASDIHIEPYHNRLIIRFRVDGILVLWTDTQPLTICPSSLNSFQKKLITRLKLLSKMDISEKRLPQDGRLSWPTQNKNPSLNITFRASVLPILSGEKIVLRRLEKQTTHQNISQLGMLPDQLKLFSNALSQPQGLILVTGPTGSGKTLTLYTALQHLNNGTRNITSIEDPVEIPLETINQITIHDNIGLSFAKTLRACLRQDPDILMIGEIRDAETADIAIKCAQTGHLVLSTLHTNSAHQALTRLKNMGIEDYNLNHSISLILAQRLLRKLCPHCKQQHPQNLNYFISHSKGCENCTQGYKGRMAIFEIIPKTNLFNQTQPNPQNFFSLHQHAQHLLNQGLTSEAEISRVLELGVDLKN